MRLEAFDAIDEALAVLAENAEVYTAASNRINALFTQRLDDDCVINVVSRVKEALSLKEKIIRKKLYAKHRSGKEIMQELSDVVGVRVECRFIKDEDEVFSRIKGMFSKQKDGYCYLEDVPDIWLELMTPQPKKQQPLAKSIMSCLVFSSKEYMLRISYRKAVAGKFSDPCTR